MGVDSGGAMRRTWSISQPAGHQVTHAGRVSALPVTSTAAIKRWSRRDQGLSDESLPHSRVRVEAARPLEALASDGVRRELSKQRGDCRCSGRGRRGGVWAQLSTTESPRRIVPPLSTEAYTPTFTSLC